MFPPHPAIRAGQRVAFTLLELLIVVAIVAVLASILLSVTGSVQNNARKVQAVNDMRNVRVAMLSFYTDYQKYPVTPQQAAASTSDTVFGDAGGNYSSADLFDILRATDWGPAHGNQGNAINTSQTVYWQGPLATSLTKPRNGISQQNISEKDKDGATQTISRGSLMDPWGQPYLIFIDMDQNGDLSSLAGYYYSGSNFTFGTVLTASKPNGIELVSLGPDGVFGTKSSANPNGNHIFNGSDDLATWRISNAPGR